MGQTSEQKLIQALKNAGDYFARQYEAMVTAQYEEVATMPEAVQEDKKRAIAETDTELREQGGSILLLHAEMAQGLAATMETGTTSRGVPWRDSNDVANIATTIILALAVMDNKNPILQEIKTLDQECGLGWTDYAREKWQHAPAAYKRSDIEIDKLSFDLANADIATDLLAIIEDNPPQKTQQKKTGKPGGPSA